MTDNRNRPGQGAASDDQQAADHLQHKPATDVGADIAGDAEFATIGAVVLAASSVQDRALSIVDDDDFADPRCKFAIGIIRRMRAEQRPVDPLLLTGYVQRHGLLEGGAPRITLSVWLSEIASAAPVPASATWYAELVVEAAARRAAEFAGKRITAAAQGDSLSDLAAIVAEELVSVTAAISRVGGRNG